MNRLVNLSDEIALAARLQNRACDFHRTRLLSDMAFVIRTSRGWFPSRFLVMAMAMQELEVGKPIRPAQSLGLNVIYFQHILRAKEEAADPTFPLLVL